MIILVCDFGPEDMTLLRDRSNVPSSTERTYGQRLTSYTVARLAVHYMTELATRLGTSPVWRNMNRLLENNLVPVVPLYWLINRQRYFVKRSKNKRETVL